MKDLCSKPPVLGYYDVNKPVQIECDASKDGLGAVLMQENRVLAYSSRSLTETEKRYAQIEKEMLSIVYSTSKFHCFIFGKETTVFTDHKPLEQLFNKPLLAAPMRIQKWMLKLQWYDLAVKYRKGTEMYVSDALSRAYLPAVIQCEEDDRKDMIGMISVSTSKYKEIQETTHNELKVLFDTVNKGWPDARSQTPIEARPYWDSRDQLSILDGIIYKGLRIVIPQSLRNEMLKLVHKSHLGISKCKQRAREVMYWPSMNADIDQLVSNCSLCAEHQNQQPAEPLQPTPTPDLPYSLVGCDVFVYVSKKYLLVVDYYSKYIDVEELDSESTSAIVKSLKTVFACHGIPVRLRSDNGPQFSSLEFRRFCQTHGIDHETSSPHFQSSNGEAERAIQTVKKLWKKSEDRQLALLDYRTTPLEGLQLSPAQLLMGRRPRNTLPASKELLKPRIHDPNRVKSHFEEQKSKQKFYYDHRRGVKELPPLNNGTDVRMKTPGSKSWSPGKVIKHHEKPRSYIVDNGSRLLRRNRKHLRETTELANKRSASDLNDPDDNLNHSPEDDKCTTPSDHVDSDQKEIASPLKMNTPVDSKRVTRSGRQVIAPQKLDL